MFKALSEYLKIVSTVNYVDLDLIHFLHNAFLGKNFNVYSDLFAMDKEPNLLVNLSWTYTKAVVYVHRLYQKEEEYSDLLTKGPGHTEVL